MLRSFGKSLVVVLACAASGCSTSCCYDFLDDTMTGCHDHLEAKLAWHRCQGCFCEVEYIADFRLGFIDGYIHVMSGGGNCRPTLPPRKYWSLCTRGEDNNCRIVAWYNGWDSGVAQALRDGMGSGPITTAADIYQTNNVYPVSLPDDLLRRTGDETTPVAPGQEMLPDGQEYFPAEPGVNPLPEDAPPPALYNPPAAPVSENEIPGLPADDRVYFSDSLAPPAPPRTDGFGN